MNFERVIITAAGYDRTTVGAALIVACGRNLNVNVGYFSRADGVIARDTAAKSGNVILRRSKRGQRNVRQTNVLNDTVVYQTDNAVLTVVGERKTVYDVTLSVERTLKRHIPFGEILGFGGRCGIVVFVREASVDSFTRHIYVGVDYRISAVNYGRFHSRRIITVYGNRVFGDVRAHKRKQLFGVSNYRIINL